MWVGYSDCYYFIIIILLLVVCDSNLKFKKEEVSEKGSPKEYCSWEEVGLLTKIVADKIQSSNKRYDSILGITNGGIIPARLMALELDVNHIQFIPVRNKKLHKEGICLHYLNTKNIL